MEFVCSMLDVLKYFYVIVTIQHRSIVNWIIMTRKSGELLRTTYENTRYLFRPVVEIPVYTANET